MTSSVRPRRQLPPLAALRAVEAAAHHLSFQKAAAELGVTATAISHHIRHAEAILGRPLFTRHVRRVSLTPAGALLYPVLRGGLDSFDEAWSRVAASRSRAKVVLSATRLFTARRLVPALGDFARQHPEVDLHLHASDLIVDLASGEADLAIRYGNGPFGDLVVEPLLDERIGVLCSPALGVTVPDDLRHVPLLHCEWTGPSTAPDWASWAHRAGMTDLPIETGARFSDDAHAVQAAIAGHGAVVSSLTLAQPDLAAGLLVHPFGPVIEQSGYHLVATAAGAARPEVEVVRGWLRLLRSGA